MSHSFDEIETTAVVGAGLMGAGIAQVLAVAGYRVILHDQNATALAAAIEGIGGRIDRLAEKGQMTAAEAGAAKARLTAAGDLAELAPAQVVIEAVIERLDVKQELFKRLEGIVGEKAILASNTSSLTIAAIGKDCARRDRICGMHFFNPVPLLALVEVIAGPFTSQAVVDLALRLVERMGKVPVLAKDGPGFLVNLGGRAFYTEALHIEAEGVAPPEQIDRIMKQAVGFRMGPFELMDLTGIDTNNPVTTFIWQGYQNDPRLKTTPLHGYMVEAGRFGRKAGIGFYDYAAERPAAPQPPAAGPKAALRAMVPEAHPGFERLAALGLAPVADDGAAPILVSPLGEDATSVAVRLSLDPARVVAIDFTGIERGIVTVMTPPVESKVLADVTAWLGNAGLLVEVVRDSPGFVAPRILAAIVNLCSEMAQASVGSPADIGKAMKLGLNYPFDPLELGDRLGAATVLRTLQELQAVTGSDRYRPSLWLRRRAMLGLSLRQS